MPEEHSNITKVVETSSANEVNDFLSKGWKLIDTYKTTAFSIDAADQIVMYVLGKPKD